MGHAAEKLYPATYADLEAAPPNRVAESDRRRSVEGAAAPAAGAF
jgi:hypothetical protein